MEYKLKMFWGSEMTDSVAEKSHEEKKEIPEDEYEVIEYTFNSLDEMNAFLSGVEAMNGWQDYDYIEL